MQRPGQEGIPQNFGQPPQGGGVVRFLAITRNFALGTVGLSLLIFAAEKVLPASFTPSSLIGGFLANVEVAEITKKQAYTTGYAAGMAEAQAQAQARAQIEVEVNRQQQQRLSDSMGMQVAASNAADFGCYAAMFLHAFGDSDDAKTLSGACGAGTAIRQAMAKEQATVGRNNGSVETRDVFQPAPPPAPAVPQQAAVTEEHRQFQRLHEKEWEASLGTARLQTIIAKVPGGYANFPEYLNELEKAVTNRGARADPHFQFQQEHESAWMQKLGQDRVVQIVASIPPYGGLPDFLNRLEEAATQ
jgi:hypothetical protein